MTDKNSLIVILVICAAFLVIVSVAYLSQGSAEEKPFDHGQRFTAKPGTTRENAMLLTSRNRPNTEDPKDAIARRAEEVEDSDPLEVKSLSTPETGAERTGPAADIAREALSSFSPETGLQALEQALALPNQPDQAAQLHEASGQLYAQLSPPDYDKSRESFARAAASAVDPDLKEEIEYHTVQMLLQAGRDQEALEAAESQLAARPPETITGHKLLLLKGQLLERTGQSEAAEKTYHTVLDGAEALKVEYGAEPALSLARVAGLRLTHLYRKHDRNQAADELSRDLKKRLYRLQEG